MSTQYSIKNKESGKVISCDWQNAFELVNHGFWEWAKGDGRAEFRRATAEARNTIPQTEGFDHLGEPPETSDDNDNDGAPEPAPTPAAPAKTVEQVAAVKPVASDDDGLEDMDRDELFAVAEKIGATIDKRVGTKNLIAAIRAHQEGGN